jgi:hypothetical protein
MLGVFGSTPANAQTFTCTPPDPYTGQQQCTLQITLHLSLTFGPPGINIRIQAFGFIAGDPVAGTFDGVQVFSATARPGVGQTTAAVNPVASLAPLFGKLTHQVANPTFGGVDETITVPNKPPAEYAVCVYGSGAQGCGTFRIVPATQVLGVQITRNVDPASAAGAAGAATSANTNGSVSPKTNGGAALARTGLDVGLLLLLGVGFVVFGRYLRAASKRRQPASS